MGIQYDRADVWRVQCPLPPVWPSIQIPLRSLPLCIATLTGAVAERYGLRDSAAGAVRATHKNLQGKEKQVCTSGVSA